MLQVNIVIEHVNAKRMTILWVRFCTELKQTVLNSWYVKAMGVRRVVKTGFFPSLEIGTKNQIF